MTQAPVSSRAGRWTSPGIILFGLIVAISMTTIDQTIVSLAAPSIQSGLGLSQSGIEWMVNAYLLAAAAAFPCAGRLADTVGYRTIMLIGIVVFASASTACGLTPAGSAADAWMIVARCVQGIGSALMFPSALGILVDTAPSKSRASSMAKFFAITGAMTAVGPIAGGYLVNWTWRSIFFINVPLALASFVLVWITAPRSSSSVHQHGIDPVGSFLASATMVCAVLPLQQGGNWGWTSSRTIGCFVAAAILLCVFIVQELHVAVPVMRIRAFRDRGFALSSVSILLASIAFVPIMYFISVYGQISLGFDLNKTSELILQFFVGYLVAAQLGARAFERVGASRTYLVGGIIGVVGFVMLARTVTVLDSSSIVRAVSLMLAGAGIGFMFSPAATDMIDRAIGATYGEVTALSQTFKNFGGALGMAVFSSVATSGFTRALGKGLSGLGIPGSDIAGVTSTVEQAMNGRGASSAVQSQPGFDQVMEVVRSSYAVGVSRVFWGMALVMCLIAAVGLLYRWVVKGARA